MSFGLKSKEITNNMAKAIMHFSNLPKREMCTGLEAVYSDGICPYMYKITDEKIGEGAYGKTYKTCCQDNCNDYVAKWQPNVSRAKREATLQFLASQHNLAPIVRELWICDLGGIVIMDALKTSALENLEDLSDEQKDTAKVSPLEKQKIIEKAKILGINEDVDLKTLKDYQTYMNYINELISLENKKGRSISFLNEIKYKVSVPDSLTQIENKKKIIDDIITLLTKIHNLTEIVHNDAHLGNFMTDQDGKYKIIDFGLATHIQNSEGVKDFKELENSLIRLREKSRHLNYLLDYFYTSLKINI